MSKNSIAYILGIGALAYLINKNTVSSNATSEQGSNIVWANTGIEGSTPKNMSAPPNVVVSPFGGTMALPTSDTTFPINTPQMSNLTPLQSVKANTPVPSITATTALLTNVSVQAAKVASSDSVANDPLVASINLARSQGVTNQQITTATQKVSGSAPSTTVYFDARGKPIYVRG